LTQYDEKQSEDRRYQLYEGAERTEVHSGQGRWYFRNELLWMLQLAGFNQVTVATDFTGQPLGSRPATIMVFTAVS
jgi:hypothetical protein